MPKTTLCETPRHPIVSLQPARDARTEGASRWRLLALSLVFVMAAAAADAAQVYVDTAGYNYSPGDYYVQWYHGCGPTAAGTIMNYWENNGYAGILNGGVDQSIASNGHIRDYYENPIVGDRGSSNASSNPDPVPPDPLAVGHADDSLADFMGTSRAGHSNGALHNGSTYVMFAGTLADGDLASGVDNYADWRVAQTADGTLSVEVDTIEAPVAGGDSTLGWTNFTAEIDSGRPVIFWVDTSGNGSGDHFVPVFGYDDTAGAYQYYAYSEWGPAAPGASGGWHSFAQLSGSYSWGVGAMTAIRFDNDPVADFGPGGAGWGAGGDGWMGGGGGAGGSPEPETWALLIVVVAGLAWSLVQGRLARAR